MQYGPDSSFENFSSSYNISDNMTMTLALTEKLTDYFAEIGFILNDETYIIIRGNFKAENGKLYS